MSVRLISYNMRKAVGLDRKRAPGRILDVINRLDGDIVLLQEADKRLGDRPAALPRRMIEENSDFTVAPLAPNDVSLGWHGNAVLVRKGLTVLDTARLDLPGLEPRGAVLARIGTPEGDLTVVGTHLALLRPWRRQQIEAILDHLDDDQKARSLIAGDFNEWSETLGLEALGDSHAVLAPGKTFHASRPMASLDRIAHGRALDVTNAGVDQSATAKRSSDHLPIWADIRRVPDPDKT